MSHSSEKGDIGVKMAGIGWDTERIDVIEASQVEKIMEYLEKWDFFGRIHRESNGGKKLNGRLCSMFKPSIEIVIVRIESY